MKDYVIICDGYVDYITEPIKDFDFCNILTNK